MSIYKELLKMSKSKELVEQVLVPNNVRHRVNSKGKTYIYTYKIIKLRVPDNTKLVKIKWLDNKRAILEIETA